MTNKELRAKIYDWVYECYKINVTTGEQRENRKKLKEILNEYNPTQPQPKVAEKKEYINTSGKTQVWRKF